jgi:thiosulfate/3-mercaptopyruvate sulfurtransferase
MDEMTTDELAARLGELTILDVRTEAEYGGEAGYPCDPRQGHLPGARNLDVARLGEARTVEEVRELVGEPEGAEVVVYCHSGGRSQRAAQILDAAGYRARNYAGSWHEWSRREDLPAEP